MADLTPAEEKVVKAMQELGATDEAKMKTADDVARKVGMGKGIVNGALQSLIAKGLLRRKAREKAAGYYLVKAA
jgi:predicted transcriptional regulator